LNASIDLSGSLKLPKTSEHPTDVVFFENEDSNSSSIYQLSSSTGLPQQPQQQQPPTYTMNKRLKSKQTAFRDLSINSPRPLNEFAATGTTVTMSEATMSEHTQSDQNEVEEETSFVMECPVQDCDSTGNLDGVSERHYSFDACPRYFSIKQEECAERRVKLDKLLAEINEKSKKTADSRKSIRNKVSFSFYTTLRGLSLFLQTNF
jgi:hypothetical protein